MIKCKSLQRKELYVTATGELLPCCFLHDELLNNKETNLRELLKNNFEGLVKSWTTDTPFKQCYETCSDKNEDKPWHISNIDATKRIKIELTKKI